MPYKAEHLVASQEKRDEISWERKEEEKQSRYVGDTGEMLKRSDRHYRAEVTEPRVRT